jgi:hypothetical protein
MKRSAPEAYTNNNNSGHDPKATDALLVQELNGLSMDEREDVNSDIHGVAKEIDEQPEFVADRLLKIGEEIGKITSKNAYDKAVFLAPHYVKSRDFRLLFLRADRFHPRKAARRIVDYFSEKVKLFGLDKLLKPITQDDLDEDDIVSMKTGCRQLLANKDRSGRGIMFITPAYAGNGTVQSNVRRIKGFHMM